MKSTGKACWAVGTVLAFACALSPGDTIIDTGTLQVNPGPTGAPPVGALIWLDATQAGSFTMNGANVADWADRTGNGQSVSQSNAARQPTIAAGAINGLDAVRFDTTGGADQLFNATNYASPVSVFSVSQLTGGADYRLITSYTNNWLLGYHGHGTDKAYLDGWVNNPTIQPDTLPHMYNTIIRGGSSNSDLYVFDARNPSDMWLKASNGGGRSGPNGLALGAWGSGAGEGSNGLVGEVLIYNGVLSDSDRQQVERYLMTKWFNYSDAIPDDSPVSIAGGATLDLTNVSETIGPLSGSGQVLQTAGTLGLNTTANATFTGSYSGGAANLSKLGLGQQVMSGPVSYTGQTTIQAGELALGSANTIGSPTSMLLVGPTAGWAGTLSANGGTIQASTVVVGGEGAGTLNLTNTDLTANSNPYYGALVVGLTGNAVGTVNQNGGTVTVNNNYMILGRYSNAQGTYTITDGTLRTAGASGDRNLYIAWDSSGARGTLNVSGTALVDLNGWLQVAANGTGVVNQSGGTVQTNNNAVKIGANAAARATYNISGGVLQTLGTSGDRNLYMAWDQAGSQGTLNISGTGVVNVAGELKSGNGLATINIADSGQLNLYNRFELTGAGTAVVNQTGGTVTVNNSHIVLGRVANGRTTYNISDGLLQTLGTGNRNLYLAWEHATNQGTLNASGGAQISIAEGINTGKGIARLNLSDNAHLTAAGAFTMSNNADAAATYVTLADDASLSLGGELNTRHGIGDIQISGNASLTTNGSGGDGGIVLGRHGTGVGTITQTGGTVTINRNHLILGRWDSSQGTYDISAGLLQTAGTSGNLRIHLGWDSASSVGRLNLSGTGQVVTNVNKINGTGGVHVADRGKGYITVADSAQLTINAGGDGEGGFSIGRHGDSQAFVTQTGGTVTVNDNWLLLGRWDNAQGTYDISGGVLKTAGTINSNRRIHLGWDSATATGTMNISGNAQVITNADNSNPNNNGVGMFVGYNGTGVVTVADNAQLTINAAGDPDGGLIIAWNGGTSSFTQTGGTVTLNNNYLLLGRSNAAQGTMTVNGGTFTQTGTVGDRNTYLGWNSTNAKGYLNVGGTGVVNLGGDLNVGYDGTGAVTVSGNGQLHVPGVIHLAARATAQASLALNGGVLTTGGLNAGGGAATVSFDGGTLRAGRDFGMGMDMTLNAGGGTIDTNDRQITSLGAIGGTGGLTKAGGGTLRLGGTHSYGGDTVVAGGTLQLIPTPHQAYQIGSHAVNGNQSHPGSLGYDFRVNPGQSVLVTALGFYDSADNMGLAVGHDMFITDPTNTTTYASTAIAAGTGSPLLSGYRFVELATPVTLGPGTYRIWGYNYGQGDKDYNVNGTAPGPTDGGSGGEISFGNGSFNGGWWQNGNVFPINNDASPLYRYGAVSFLFIDGSPDTALPAGTNVRVASGATLDLFGLDQTVASLGDEGGSGGTVLLGGATLTLNVPAAASASFSGGVTGTGAIVKTGDGSQFFNGAVGTSLSPVSLAVNDGLVGGTGPFSGPITVGDNGTLSAGNSPGHMVVSGSDAPVDYTQTGTLLAEIGGPNQGFDYDWVEVFGAASVSGTIDIDRFNDYLGFGPFYVLTATGEIDVKDLTLDGSGAAYGHYEWRWSLVDWGQGGQALRLDLVPEPMTLLALGLGMTGLGGYIRRRETRRN
ncbi:MAG TPA: autotransporter-associated beta strand repeat-containing protein [Phycisphaerae bacterium]|nr:autotransporter-associated beta strand repeat-containing protein [Phycisphaerae bacterium]HQL71765.1 autotransporter-associated beta strand repeat-containing protein [Phycisphaerae bacterium]